MTLQVVLGADPLSTDCTIFHYGGRNLAYNGFLELLSSHEMGERLLVFSGYRSIDSMQHTPFTVLGVDAGVC